MIKNYQYLHSYLLEILTHKKHFNIVEELQKSNILKRENNLKNLLKSNPFDFDKSMFEPFVKKEVKNTYRDTIENIKDVTFKEIVLFEFNLLEEYKKLWNLERVNEFKYKKGKQRDDLHIELFKKIFFTTLKIGNKKLIINDDFNICYVAGEVEFATKLSDILELIETLNKNRHTLFFRGHNNASHRLIPSIYRGNAPFYEKEIFYDTISTLTFAPILN